MAVLQVQQLAKTFSSGYLPWTKKQYTAVNAISFDVHKGEILGLLGPNGAGKTTTISMLLGILTPTHGSIDYFGTDFLRNPTQALKKIGYASGYDRLPPRLTILENLDVVGRIYNLSAHVRMQQIEKLLQFFDIWGLRHRQTGSLSAGQATRVMLAKAFIANPEIVLLDEPTASLDPDVAHEVRHFILEQQQEHNTSILITSHNMDEVTELCNRVLILKHGAIIADSTPEQLAQSIAQVHVHLTFENNLQQALNYLNTIHAHYTIQANQVAVALDEHAIAEFLAKITQQNIRYTHISIDKPTLEDYFLSIAK